MSPERHTPHVCVAVVPRERMRAPDDARERDAPLPRRRPALDRQWSLEGVASRSPSRGTARDTGHRTAVGASRCVAQPGHRRVRQRLHRADRQRRDRERRLARRAGSLRGGDGRRRSLPHDPAGESVRTSVHFGGGSVFCDVEDGHLVISDVHDHPEMLPGGGSATPRHRTGLCELHCVLLRRRALQRVGNLDPGIANRELIDWFLRLHALGGTTWAEPSSVVTYSVPPPFTLRRPRLFPVAMERTVDRSQLRTLRVDLRPAVRRGPSRLDPPPTSHRLLAGVRSARSGHRPRPQRRRQGVLVHTDRGRFQSRVVTTWRTFDRRVW